jgi:hypothetical protein
MGGRNGSTDLIRGFSDGGVGKNDLGGCVLRIRYLLRRLLMWMEAM